MRALVHLGQLPGQKCVAFAAENRPHVRKRLADPMHGFIEHQSLGNAAELLKPCTARGLAGRQKSLKVEAVGGQAGHGKGRHRGAGPGQRDHAHARLPGVPHQPASGIADAGRARVAQQRQVLAGAQSAQNSGNP